MSAEPDRLRELLQGHAHAALADALKAGRPAGALKATVRDQGLVVTVSVVPAVGGADPSDLTPCERDVLAILEASSSRLSTSRVLTEMARRGLPHSEPTVKRRLARLVKAGLICASRRAPRGYYLPGRPYPLFPDHA